MGKERNIHIDGILLTQGEAMTLRVAMINFLIALGGELTEEDLGVQLHVGYTTCCKSILDKMSKPAQSR